MERGRPPEVPDPPVAGRGQEPGAPPRPPSKALVGWLRVLPVLLEWRPPEANPAPPLDCSVPCTWQTAGTSLLVKLPSYSGGIEARGKASGSEPERL